MLVLSRKKGERIVIAGNVFVKVIEVRGDRVKLGFEGPDEVTIHREELAFRMVTEDASAECLAGA